MILPLTLAGAACLLTWGGGYLMGVRRSRASEAALQDALEDAKRQQIIVEAKAEARNEIFNEALSEALNRPAPQPESLDDEQIKRVVSEALAPMVDHDRLGVELANLRTGTSRADLNLLLEAIADRAGFEMVVLSDASGLLLATSEGIDEDAEVRAGVSALLITMAEHLVRSDEAAPVAFLIHDEDNRIAVSRLFQVDGVRLLLTAIAAGRHMTPTVLDPVLPHLTRLMSDWTISVHAPTAIAAH